ncbi:hypothetical protein PFICI_00468 [Pestalotiopsis fici W106-1]|uniref:DUF7708 domain-containing protein n=1 Tax=Pestalotiopsis fici (strain W106-1 / CGMCC3.15140) TaxID=1229662 RepID=W3XKX1_PESFW|nr:uncharacterized protein PFICI_00468 [Pestalotiopsis fici W106-1]ETS86640.1 hypothetical protein PFICI_00468 [Pestalotiopsis fici W106-1]
MPRILSIDGQPSITELVSANTVGSSTVLSPPTGNASWYTAGSDFCFYAVAQQAARESKARLSRLKLTPEEKQLLAIVPSSSDAVIEKLHLIVDEREEALKRPKAFQRTNKFFTAFCEVVGKTSGLVQTLVPQSPEYTIPFGVLIILFRAVVTKKDREESLLMYLEALGSKLPLVEFYRNAFPTNAMKLAVANLYAEVTKLLDEALLYYRSGRLGKLVDAVLQPTEPKFQKSMDQIDAEVKKMQDLKDVAHEAQTIDIKDTVTGNAKAISRLHENFEKATIAIGISMELISERMTGLESQVSFIGKFEMLKYAQSLQEALLSSVGDFYLDSESLLQRVMSQGFRLSPIDRWENNGILENLVAWSHGRHGPLLWVGGQSGNRDSWVTDLSMDIVQAFLPQSMTTLFVFCSDMAFNSLPPNPILLVKLLIAQLLELHPHIPYENPIFYSLQRFRHAATFDQVWRIFESLIGNLTEVFLVIDRVEMCKPGGQASLTGDLLPALARLLAETSGRRAILTSIYNPPENMSYDVARTIEKVFIDTGGMGEERK